MLKKGCLQRSVLLFFLCSFLLLIIGPISAHEQNYQIQPERIHKSQNDTRQYQAITLANQMRVLLVSDPNAIKFLGGIALRAGSLQDPVEQQGLAHFAEHMVLMGSKNYPKPDGFSEFLSKHAGKYNASTALTYTTFYFEVENSASKAALARLADAIAFPLFNKDYTDKERNAINQEATLARSREGFRIQQVESETMNQAHPAALFSGGNLETLSDKKYGLLHDALQAFYDRYYSSNLMVGVIYGKDTLSVLSEQASATFGRIENRNKIIDPIEVAPFTPKELEKIIYLEPAQPKRILYLQFPTPNNRDEFKSKSDEYIAYLINNQSKGTLAATLVKQGLIDSIDATYSPNHYGNSGTFNVALSLTEDGLVKKDHVIAAIFNYLDLLKMKGVDEKYYNEIKHVFNLDFTYQSITRDMGYVEWLAKQMLFYPITHILDADYNMGEFNERLIHNKLARLDLKNARIWVIAPEQFYNKEAYFMNAPYRIASFTTGQKRNWEALKSSWQFSLPTLNPYIATDLRLVPASSEKPTTYQFNPHGNYLYFPTKYFVNEPKGGLILSLRQNQLFNTAKEQVLFPMLRYLTSRLMSELDFQANVAGVELNDSANVNGLLLSAIGYSHYLPNLIEKMLERYEELQISENDLKLAKSWFLQQLSSADEVKSYALSMQPIYALDMLPYTERITRRHLIASITIKDLMEYKQRVLNQSVPYLLAVGNIDKNRAASLYEKIKARLPKKNKFIPTFGLSINQTGKALFRQIASSTDSAIGLVYFPKKELEKADSNAKGLLLSKIIAPWFFKQLRSDEQLAYAIFNFPITIGQSYGFGFLIQSNQYDPDYLFQRYQAFFPKVFLKLNGMNEKAFNQYKIATISELLNPPQTLTEEINFYLDDFMKSNFQFDTHRKHVSALQQISKADLLRFYRELVLEDQGFSILSEVVGAKIKEKISMPNDYTLYKDSSSLQKKLLNEDGIKNQH